MLGWGRYVSVESHDGIPWRIWVDLDRHAEQVEEALLREARLKLTSGWISPVGSQRKILVEA